ncbi:hypothetical protein PM082_020435 [Marasmius tenuissimus]|nr:hypothetical protein PM082_020435 [Marasmius tenuissimus]
MPYLNESAPSAILAARDFGERVTPNATQRTTLIVAGVYIIAIAILWWVAKFYLGGSAAQYVLSGIQAYTHT